MKNIFVGNLNSTTTPDAIQTLFAPLGAIRRLKLMTDSQTGLSRGFGFVWMPDGAADRAIKALQGTTVDGHTIEVREGRQLKGL
jgi:RNA recognition motif-containing protein